MSSVQDIDLLFFTCSLLISSLLHHIVYTSWPGYEKWKRLTTKSFHLQKKMQNCQKVALTFMLSSKLFSRSLEEQLLHIEEHQRMHLVQLNQKNQEKRVLVKITCLKA